jgi:hypothetical protein
VHRLLNILVLRSLMLAHHQRVQKPFQSSSILEALKIYGLFVDCGIDGVDPKPKQGSALDLSGSCIPVIMQVLGISHAIGPHWCNRTSTTYSTG